MFRTLEVSLFDLVFGLSEAIDLISKELNLHQQRVAYIAYKTGLELKYPAKQLNTVTIAAALHDIGALSLQERLQTLQFEDNMPQQHQERGYRLLKTFEPFTKAADYIRCHHVHWSNWSEEMPLESNLIFLADRASVLLPADGDVIYYKNEIISNINRLSGSAFHPDFVNAFNKTAAHDSFWIELTLPVLKDIISERTGTSSIYLNKDSLYNIARLFSRIIDFRSKFTSTHSSGVAAAAQQLGKLCNFCERECFELEIAGYLHDIGKLSVSAEILEKNGPLTAKERDIIQKHAYYTYKILDQIRPLKSINESACLHHERINGKGYPFGLKGSDLSLSARIMAVADVFTAITEERPYRKGMQKEQAVKALSDMVENGVLDKQIVAITINNYQSLHDYCQQSQQTAMKEYEAYRTEILLDGHLSPKSGLKHAAQ